MVLRCYQLELPFHGATLQDLASLESPGIPWNPYRPSVYLSTPRSLGGWVLPHIATARLQGRKGDNVALVASREAPSKARANRDNLGSCRSLWRAAPKVGIYRNII